MKVVALQAAGDLDPAQWNELRAHCPDATVFQGRAWLKAWLDAFAPAPERVRLFAAFDGLRLVGLAPLVRDEHDGAWRFVGDDYSDYQTFLAWDCSAHILDSLLKAIDAALPPGESVLLNDLPQFSALALHLADRARSVSSGIQAGGWIVCPALNVCTNPQGVARVLRKDSLLRHERALRKFGDVSVEHTETAGAAAALLPTLFDQHIERWAGTASPSLFLKPHNRRFYEVVTRELAASRELLYSAIRLDGRVVAQHFGLRSRDSLLWYKPAFDVSLKRASPGEVLLKSLVEYTLANGCRELDFTRGGEAFKTRFASGVSYNRHFIWHRRFGSAVKARMLERAKAAVRGVLRRGAEAPLSLGGAARADTTLAPVHPSDEAAPARDIILCLCVDGKLARCFTGDVPNAAATIHAAAVFLDSLRWQGFAAVTLEKGLPVAASASLQGPLEAASAAGVDFVADMLRVAQGHALPPQDVFGGV